MNTVKETKDILTNELLYDIYIKNFKPLINKDIKSQEEINDCFFEISKNDLYEIPNINYEIILSNRQANGFIKKHNLNDLVQNYKNHFAQTLKTLLIKNNKLSTIYNYILYYVLLFKSLYEKYNKETLQFIHEYFKNILQSFRGLIMNRKNKIN